MTLFYWYLIGLGLYYNFFILFMRCKETGDKNFLACLMLLFSILPGFLSVGLWDVQKHLYGTLWTALLLGIPALVAVGHADNDDNAAQMPAFVLIMFAALIFILVNFVQYLSQLPSGV